MIFKVKSEVHGLFLCIIELYSPDIKYPSKGGYEY
ncbi:hypothetical protein HNR35_000947 [Borreliella spielmanii]|uniref:Uncharacterized protein n=1 Tax=Borreliella spielmanii TaxID=88916 RepID=A0ABR6P7D9_9SPIR|nr:hypothetical protein [Borreliella spielmanii]